MPVPDTWQASSPKVLDLPEFYGSPTRSPTVIPDSSFTPPIVIVPHHVRPPRAVISVEELCRLDRGNSRSPIQCFPQPSSYVPHLRAEDEKISFPGSPDSLPYNSVPKPVQVIDKAFEECEEFRQSTFLEDQKIRGDYGAHVAKYIQEAGNRRQTQFKELIGYFDKQLVGMIDQHKSVCTSRAEEYTAVESYRDSVSSNAATQKQIAFDDMIAFAKVQTGSLEIAQSEHACSCYGQIDDLLTVLRSIVTQTRTELRQRFDRFIREAQVDIVNPSPAVEVPQHLPIAHSSPSQAPPMTIVCPSRSRSRSRRSRSRSPRGRFDRGRTYSPSPRRPRFSPSRDFRYRQRSYTPSPPRPASGDPFVSYQYVMCIPCAV